jgi:hypothetical protein
MVLRDIVLRQANLFGSRPVHIHTQVGPMDELMHVGIDCSGNLRDARFDFVGDVVPFRVATGYLNIDRRRNAEI